MLKKVMNRARIDILRSNSIRLRNKLELHQEFPSTYFYKAYNDDKHDKYGDTSMIMEHLDCTEVFDADKAGIVILERAKELFEPTGIHGQLVLDDFVYFVEHLNAMP